MCSDISSYAAFIGHAVFYHTGVFETAGFVAWEVVSMMLTYVAPPNDA